VKVIKECIVIALRVEVDNSSLAELALLCLNYLNILQQEKLVEKVLQIFFGGLEMQVAQKTLADVVRLHDLLDDAASTQQQIGLPQVVHQLTRHG
jgi:hypothetical protein